MSAPVIDWDDPEERESVAKHVDNLETLVVRLARYIEKATDGDSLLASQAMDYIRRKAIGCHSILRTQPEGKDQ